MLLRVDEGDTCNSIHPNVLKGIKWDEYDAVVISDYCKGFLSENDIKFISEQHRLTFDQIFELHEHFSLILHRFQ